MREIVETGTDIAALAVGDPTLVASLRACNGRNYEQELARAVASGAVWRAEIGADGPYLFHVFLDEDPGAPVAGFLRDPVLIEHFRIPSGRLLVAGEECFIGAISEQDYPHMGREITVPPGEYRLIAYRVEPPHDFLDRRFAESATVAEGHAWSFGNRLPGLCLLATLGGFVVGYFVYLRTVSAPLALVPLALAAFAWWAQARYRRGAGYQAAQKVFRSLERELPSIAVVLHKHGPHLGEFRAPSRPAEEQDSRTRFERTGDRVLVTVLVVVIAACVLACLIPLVGSILR